MKPRQDAILKTVARWARIYTGRRSDEGCHLCDISREDCSDCPYTEVFQRECYRDFPSLNSCTYYYHAPRAKLRRAVELARQYGLQRQAVLILRTILPRKSGRGE